jgi:O-acetyl-ADP-ribose deacetylase (regulator of RNase III)
VAFTLVTGDLFDLGLPAVGHGCNCAGAMGAGIAVEFKRRFPAMYQVYRRRCRQGSFRLGDIFVWDEEPGLVVYNLATQSVPRPSATLRAIDTSIRAALADAERRGLARLAVPRIGAGLGGLAWPDVEAVLRQPNGRPARTSATAPAGSSASPITVPRSGPGTR